MGNNKGGLSKSSENRPPSKPAPRKNADKPTKGVEAARKTGDRNRIAHEVAHSLAKPGGGKLHENYRKEVLKISDSTANSYRAKLRGMKISEIRRTARILKAKTGKESAKQRVLSLREEQARRIRTYCDEVGTNTFRLNYTKVAASHYWKIGLGEIFINATLLRIKKKDGTIVMAKRMVVPSGRHRGRLAFCNIADNSYVATYDGDEVTIMDNQYRVNVNNKAALASHVRILDQEEATRRRHADSYKKIEDFSASADMPTSGPLAMFGPNDGHIDKKRSILSQIKYRLKPIQRRHVEIIIREARAVRTREFPNGLPNNLIAAMIINAKKESDLRNIQSSCRMKDGSRERSFGLFQRNWDASHKKGETVEQFAKRHLDPVHNTREIIRCFLGWAGKRMRRELLAARRAGKRLSVQQLTFWWTTDILCQRGIRSIG